MSVRPAAKSRESSPTRTPSAAPSSLPSVWLPPDVVDSVARLSDKLATLAAMVCVCQTWRSGTQPVIRSLQSFDLSTNFSWVRISTGSLSRRVLDSMPPMLAIANSKEDLVSARDITKRAMKLLLKIPPEQSFAWFKAHFPALREIEKEEWTELRDVWPEPDLMELAALSHPNSVFKQEDEQELLKYFSHNLQAALNAPSTFQHDPVFLDGIFHGITLLRGKSVEALRWLFETISPTSQVLVRWLAVPGLEPLQKSILLHHLLSKKVPAGSEKLVLKRLTSILDNKVVDVGSLLAKLASHPVNLKRVCTADPQRLSLFLVKVDVWAQAGVLEARRFQIRLNGLGLLPGADADADA